ncbi:MAG TPA: LytTR family DNA-binding domain-containing protein [Puia sp.]|nr:LytTR family DNA-binding domain-containing protein [Puia sp.]
MQSFFFIRREGRYVKVDFRNIVYIEAKKNYTRLMLEDKSTVLVLGTLKQWERLLPCDLFCRVHRGYIVSIEKIVAFDNKHVYLPGSEIITIGDQYRNALPDSVTILAQEPAHSPARSVRKDVLSELEL